MLRRRPSLEHVIVTGMSLNNSHFARDTGNVAATLEFAARHAERILVMIPDGPAIHTLQAQGRTGNLVIPNRR
jgi:hypothetical protein